MNTNCNIKQKEVILSVKNLTKSFGVNQVLNGINIDVIKGDVVAIIGPSGCGKSTFLRCLNRLEEPTGGEIIFNGENIISKKVNINKHRQKIGMVFQQFNLFNNLTVMKNLMLAPVKLKLKTKEEAKVKALELLKRIGLEEKADAYPSTLSGGQKQRIAIIRALMMEPDVMLFDEPTSALDPELTGEVLKVIRSLADDKHTIIIVTHEMGFAKSVSDKVVFLYQGKVEEYGDAKTVLDNPKSEALKNFLSNVNNKEA